jgi:hypothetical protein
MQKFFRIFSLVILERQQRMVWKSTKRPSARFISHKAKLNNAGAKTALQEILILEEIQG